VPDRDPATFAASLSSSPTSTPSTSDSETSIRTSSIRPTRPEDFEGGAIFRLETRLGDLNVMQWIPAIDSEPAYRGLAMNAINGELGGVPLHVCGLDDLVAMKRAAGRSRDLDDLQRLGAT